MIKNNSILDFYGTAKPLFVMNELSGDELHRFVDRGPLLDYFIASIRMGQRCAVIGEPGTGKTSFLLKLMDMVKDSIHCEYLRFSFPMENSKISGVLFLQKIYRTLLSLTAMNDRSLNQAREIDSLSNAVVKLLEQINDPIVFFIDELDKVGRYPLESPSWEKDVEGVLNLAGKIALSNKLKFVFALRIEFYEKFRNALIDEGDDSILELIDSFKKLDGFDLDFSTNAVNSSLEYAGYKCEIEDLFENGVIEIVLSVVKGNPRLFMYYLIELSKAAFLEKQPRITLALLKNYLREIDVKITETKWNSLLKKAR